MAQKPPALAQIGFCIKNGGYLRHAFTRVFPIGRKKRRVKSLKCRILSSPSIYLRQYPLHLSLHSPNISTLVHKGLLSPALV
jgi:hypothetical protein